MFNVIIQRMLDRRLNLADTLITSNDIYDIISNIPEVMKRKYDVYYAKNDHPVSVMGYTPEANALLNTILYSGPIPVTEYYKINPYLSLYNDLCGRISDVWSVSSDRKISTSAWLTGYELADRLNSSIGEIRKIANSKSFKADHEIYRKYMVENSLNIKEYIRHLVSEYSEFMAFRLVLGLDGSIDDISKSRYRLFNNLRSNKMFKDMLGYIWKLEYDHKKKLEYDHKKGYYFHILFFYDRCIANRTMSIMKDMGEYWYQINDESGYYDIAEDTDGYIMVNSSNISKFTSVADSYLNKPDYYVRLDAPSNRSISRGMTHKKRVSIRRLYKTSKETGKCSHFK